MVSVSSIVIERSTGQSRRLRAIPGKYICFSIWEFSLTPLKRDISCLKDDHENLCIAYDNFDYQENVHHQVMIEDILSAEGNQHGTRYRSVTSLMPSVWRILMRSARALILPRKASALNASSILSPERTLSMTLGPIPAEEGTIAGNYDILHNIFIHQLGFNPDIDFSTRLFLAFGDQLTVSRIRLIKFERREARSAINSWDK
jgi:uncharacterized protein DUF6589